MAAIRARSGSEARALVGMVRVASAEREEGSLPVMVGISGMCVWRVGGFCTVGVRDVRSSIYLPYDTCKYYVRNSNKLRRYMVPSNR